MPKILNLPADELAANRRLRLLAVPFFTSGVAALTYQICWQRLLFAAFGVDIQSITIIVSTFMLGLGVGAIFGGQVADRFPTRVPSLFAAAEFLIGAFGLMSADLIALVGDATVDGSLFAISAANFALLLLPTALMGATLPMLVTFLVQQSKNVGISIGSLYFINTLGAAAGAGAVGLIAFHHFDIRQTIHIAVVLNFLAGTLVLVRFRTRA